MKVECYVIFPQSLMFGASFTETSVEVFLGIAALSIKKE